MGETNWIPGLVAVGMAAIAGLALAVRARRGPRIAGLTGGRDLVRQREALYQQIRELDAGRAQMEAGDYRLERRRLELEAARTLQAMEAVAPPPPAPRAPTWGDRHPKVVGLAWGLGIAGFVAAVYLTLPDTAEAPMSTGTREAQVAAAVAELKAKADAALEDNDAQLAYARALLGTGKTREAFEIARRVTDRDPENPMARTYQAAVLIEIGDLPMAGKALDKILAAYPEHVEALAYRGLVHYMSGEREVAAGMWERVVSLDPGRAAEFNPLIQTARGAPPPPAAGTAPAAPASATPVAHADDAADVVGRIELAPTGAPPPGGVLFLYARPNGATSGPPAAARRFTAIDLPLEFRIGPGDSPMGGAFPEVLTLSARWDGDGNPMTRNPGDLEARLDGVKPGQSGVVLTLAAAN